MADSISVDEFALLEFFEVMPIDRDEDVPWLYSDSVYEVVREPIRLSFAVMPAARDVRMVVRVETDVLYELNALSIIDVRIHDDNGRKWLELLISQRQSIQLRIRPNIAIREVLSE